MKKIIMTLMMVAMIAPCSFAINLNTMGANVGTEYQDGSFIGLFYKDISGDFGIRNKVYKIVGQRTVDTPNEIVNTIYIDEFQSGSL